MQTVILDNIPQLSLKVATDLKNFILSHPGALLCLAAGDTPMPAYRLLADFAKAGEVNLNSVFYVGLDEWMGLGRGTRGSCRQMLEENFFTPAQILPERMLLWNGLCEDPQQEISRIMQFIARHGGIAYTLLGIGMNGHIGLNEPGCGLAEGGAVTGLSDTTVRVSAKYFDTPQPVRQGLTLALGELKKSGRLCLMASSAGKAPIVRAVLRGGMTPEIPASLLTDHPDSVFYLDAEAASLL